VLFSLLS